VAGVSILVVDDNSLSLELATAIPETAGYAVHPAADAAVVLGALRAFRPKLILVDIHLPGMDGLELTRRLKADPATSGIPIVGVSAFTLAGDEREAREAGCDGYLTKPISVRSLLEMVAQLLRGD
jgi:CheY-like chemotaxis protein